MAVTSTTTTVGAVSTTVFMEKNMNYLWKGSNAFLNLMATENLTMARKNNIDQFESIKNSVGKAEGWKFPVSVSALPNGGPIARGGSYTFATADTFNFGTCVAAHYDQPFAYPASDVDIFAQAKDNENSVNYVVKKYELAQASLADILGADFWTTAEPTGPSAAGPPDNLRFESVNTLVRSTGQASGLSFADVPGWTSTRFDMATARLTLDRLALDIRNQHRTKGKKIQAVVAPSGIHNLFVQEARANNLPYYDLAEVFGKSASGDKDNNLYLEASQSCWMVEGVPILVDRFLDAALNDRVYCLNLDSMGIKNAGAGSMRVKGPMEVRLEAGVDQIRGLILWDGFTWVMNRTHNFYYDNCQVS